MSKGAGGGERGREGIETRGEVFTAFFIAVREGCLFFAPGGRPRRLILGFSISRFRSIDSGSRRDVEREEWVRDDEGDCAELAFRFWGVTAAPMPSLEAPSTKWEWRRRDGFAAFCESWRRCLVCAERRASELRAGVRSALALGW